MTKSQVSLISLRVVAFIYNEDNAELLMEVGINVYFSSFQV